MTSVVSSAFAQLQMQNLQVPGFICPGQPMTISFQAEVDASNVQPQVAGVLSPVSATSFSATTDYLFLYSAGNGLTALAPGWFKLDNAFTVTPAGDLSMVTYTWSTIVPATFTTGEVIYVNLSGGEASNWATGQNMTTDPHLSVAVTVNCNDKALNNTGVFGGSSSSAALVIQQCGSTNTPTNTNSPTPTKTPTTTNTNTDTPTITNTSTPTPTYTNTDSPTTSNTFTDTPTLANSATNTNTLTLTPTYTNSNTPTPSNTYTNSPTPAVSPTCVIFTDSYSTLASASNYDYLDKDWGASNQASDQWNVTAGQFREGPMTSTAGSYLPLDPSVFPSTLTSYTVEGDFYLGTTGGNGLFGLLFMANPSTDQGYIFQWNGLNGRWEIEKQTMKYTYYYVATNSTNLYTLGTWVHLKVNISSTGVMNGYETPESAPGVSSGPTVNIFSSVTDPGTTAPYTSGTAGIRTYDIPTGNTLDVDNFTAYNCALPTNTPTPTNTSTLTNTYTSTPTPTNTQSPTNTGTPVPSATATDTPTVTNTYSSTSTPLATFTSTYTNTPTPTYTFTVTSTPTTFVGISKTVSETLANAGDVLTYNIAVTVTGTGLTSPVVTDNLPANMTFQSFVSFPSGAVTYYNASADQLQWTFSSPLSAGVYNFVYQTKVNTFAPGNTALTNKAQLTYSGLSAPLTASVPITVIGNFTVKINIYNSAGEVVKSLPIESFSTAINNIALSTTNTITTLSGPGSTIDILFNGYVIGIWDGTTSSGTPVSNGAYQIQVDNVASSGVVTSVSQKAIVNRNLSKVEVDIFNQAGEVVRRLYNVVANATNSTMTNVSLSTNVMKPNLGTTFGTTTASNLTITVEDSSSPVILVWDGSSDSGTFVTPGEYEVQVHWTDGNGTTTDITRTVLVLQSASVSGVALAEPNVLTSSTTMVTTFDASRVLNVTAMKIKIYTVAGELIQSFGVASNTTPWNASGLASGIYIANVEMDNASGGVVNSQRLKILVLH
jgi:hypothetical protein